MADFGHIAIVAAFVVAIYAGIAAVILWLVVKPAQRLAGGVK